MAAANDRCLLRRTTLLICLELSYFVSDYDQISEHRRDDILTATWLAINSYNFELLCNERRHINNVGLRPLLNISMLPLAESTVLIKSSKSHVFLI